MKKFAITGSPVSHSKSPLLFNAAYDTSLNIEYGLLPAETAKEAIELFHRNGLVGMNVTAPFKTDILAFVDEKSTEVQIIGAANTIVKDSSGSLIAYNTDGKGVAGAFAEFDVSISGKRCLLLGIGGAGKAAAYELAKAKAELTIANRTLQKACLFAEKIGAFAVSLEEIATKVADYDIIVNTLYPTVDIINEKDLRPHQVVMDASYMGSALLQKAHNKACICIDGKYWILHQAIPSFKLFTGLQPDIVKMRLALF